MQTVLTDWQLPKFTIYLLYPSRHKLPPPVRALWIFWWGILKVGRGEFIFRLPEKLIYPNSPQFFVNVRQFYLPFHQATACVHAQSIHQASQIPVP